MVPLALLAKMHLKKEHLLLTKSTRVIGYDDSGPPMPITRDIYVLIVKMILRGNQARITLLRNQVRLVVERYLTRS